MGRLLGVIVVQTQAEAVRFGRRHRKQAVPDPTLCFVYLYLLYVINNCWLSFPYIHKLVPVYDCHMHYKFSFWTKNKWPGQHGAATQFFPFTLRGSAVVLVTLSASVASLGFTSSIHVKILYTMALLAWSASPQYQYPYCFLPMNRMSDWPDKSAFFISGTISG